MLYEAQLKKCKDSELSGETQNKIALLLEKLLKSNKMTQFIIQFAIMLHKNYDKQKTDFGYVKIKSKTIE